MSRSIIKCGVPQGTYLKRSTKAASALSDDDRIFIEYNREIELSDLGIVDPTNHIKVNLDNSIKGYYEVYIYNPHWVVTFSNDPDWVNNTPIKKTSNELIVSEVVLNKSQLKLTQEPPLEFEKDKYQLRFRMSLRKSDRLLTGVLEFIKNGIVYNSIISTSSLAGRQYKGGWHYRGGLIPPTSFVKERNGVGLTVKTTPIYMPNVVGVSGNFYQIFPFEVETDNTTRGDWGIHNDANSPGCLSAHDTQVLTSDGWKYGKDLTNRDLVAQMNPFGEIVYGKPTRIILESYKGSMVSIKSNKLNMLVTPNHRVLTASTTLGKRTESYKNSIQYHTADSFTNDKEINVPISFIDRQDGEVWDKTKAQLFIAYLSDGYDQFDQTSFHFKKERKIERLESILSDVGIEAKKYNRPSNTVELKLPKLDYVEKDIDPTLALRLSYQTRVDMLKELIYWDGTSGNNTNKNPDKYSVVITSTNKTHHDFYELLAVTSGYSFNSNLYIDKRNEDWKPIYRMSIVENQRTYRLTPKSQEGSLEISNVNYDGLVFCLETETSNFIVKHQDKIFATGNSLGCIVTETDQGWIATQRELSKLANLGIKSVDLIVEYT